MQQKANGRKHEKRILPPRQHWKSSQKNYDENNSSVAEAVKDAAAKVQAHEGNVSGDEAFPKEKAKSHES